MTLKIAFPTDDGETISRHFGKANLFQVITLTDGAEAQVEQRHSHSHDPQHGHDDKFARIADCQVLIAAGMGKPAYDRVQGMGLELFVTGEKTIAAALAKYQAGELTTDMRRVHEHHHHDHDHEHQAQPIRFVDKP